MPILGVVDAAAYEAVRVTKNKKIGIIGTSATIKSGAYQKYIKEYDKGIETFEKRNRRSFKGLRFCSDRLPALIKYAHDKRYDGS